MTAGAKSDRPQRIEIGFIGGQVFGVRVSADALDALHKAVTHGEGWFDLASEDGDVAIDTGQVIFLRVAGGEHRIGFVD